MTLKKMSAFDTTGVRFGAGYLGFDGLAGWIDCILQDFLFNYFVLAVSFSIFDFRFSIFDFRFFFTPFSNSLPGLQWLLW